MTKENKKGISRRKFLVRGGLGTLGLVALGTYVFRNSLRRSALGMAEEMIVPYQGSGTEPNLWFEITTDNRIVLHSPKVEMGQGTFTSLAQMVADEMDADFNKIIVKGAETATGIIDAMSTGGSLSVAQLWQPLREMAATMREMLKIQAANKWNVDANSLTTEGSIISGNGKSMTFAEAAANVSDWKMPDTPTLRSRDKYKYIGKPVNRIDLDDKIFGSPIFGLDAEMPNMVFAAITRPEYVGAKFISADTSQAENMPGVIKVVQKDDWVGVVANTFSQALAAKSKININWDIPKKWTEADLRDMLQVGKGDKMVTQKHGSTIDTDDADVFSMEFTSPLGAHAQIEPNGAVAEVKDGKATVILSTQVIGVTQKQVAEALGFELENVNIIPTYLGGGFGRRLNTWHAVQAAQLAQEVGRPVKYIFTRKEEFQHDTFRPPTHHIVRGKLNTSGSIESLEHHYASGSVAFGSVIFPPILRTVLGTDIGAMRGGNIMYGNIPNRRAVQWHQELPFATSWWRSLGLLANTFAIESFIDELALKNNIDPVDVRLTALGNDENQQRIKNVITMARDKSTYQNDVVNGRAFGFAASIDTNAPCAHVVEASMKNKQLIVHKVTCVFDCGVVVNPDQVKAQCEGSIIMGLSSTLFERMTLKDGALYPTNYGPYDMALMKHSPRDIDVHFIEGVDVPLPAGEPPLGPIGAALGNAIRRLTGKRLTDIPLEY